MQNAEIPHANSIRPCQSSRSTAPRQSPASGGEREIDAAYAALGAIGADVCAGAGDDAGGDAAVAQRVGLSAAKISGVGRKPAPINQVERPITSAFSVATLRIVQKGAITPLNKESPDA